MILFWFWQSMLCTVCDIDSHTSTIYQLIHPLNDILEYFSWHALHVVYL